MGSAPASALHPRLTDVMLSLFVAQGLLEREDGRVRATATAREFLSKDSPLNLVPYYDSLRERPLVASMLAVLRTGTPAQWSAEPEEWSRRMADPVFAERFTAEMECRAVWLGPRLARRVDLEGRRHLLDIGGASGAYACAFAAEHEGLRATVLEKPPVDAIAAEERVRPRSRRPRGGRGRRHVPVHPRGRRRPSLLERAPRLERGRRAASFSLAPMAPSRPMASWSSTTPS